MNIIDFNAFFFQANVPNPILLVRVSGELTNWDGTKKKTGWGNSR